MDTFLKTCYKAIRTFDRIRRSAVKRRYTAKILAFSYLRFSTPEQAKGGSVRRQRELLNRWLARHPEVQLDESLRLEDKGVSGFKGKHRTNPKYALAAFLELVHRGLVPAGSYLVVENLDRLTRENPIVAIPAVLNLIAAGIRIVQLVPDEIVYDEQMEQHHLMNMLWELARGHGESKRKSGMLGNAWEAKKKEARSGKPLGKMCPAWLELTPLGYRVREQAGSAIRAIFRWCVEGMGAGAIANRLTGEGYPAIGRKGKWIRGYVVKILHERSVFGEYQPMKDGERRMPDGDPIPNYYPAVVSEADFYAAQAASQSRKGRTGRPPIDTDISNPFSGLLRCAIYECAIYRQRRGNRFYLMPARSRDGEAGVKHLAFPLEVFCDALLSQMEELKDTDLFDDPGSSKVKAIEDRLKDVDRRLNVAVQAFEADPASPTWSAKVTQYDKEKQSLLRERKQAEAEARNPLPSLWREAVKMIAEDNPERLRAVLLQTIDGIYCVFAKAGYGRVAAVQVFFKGGASRLYAIHWRRAVCLPGKHKPDSWSFLSLPSEPGKPPIDLRKIKDAKRLEKLLSQDEA
jgi:DNA invertase Pin-like site-specific DNA recombinase